MKPDMSRERSASAAGLDTPTPDTFGAGEPIAVIGMACRFPGAENLDAFWRLLESGGNAVTRGAPGSGDGRVGEMFPEDAQVHDASRYGAFLSGIDQFDPAFFRISPLEAQSLDPQQRLLLELSWEALEDAGIDPAGLVGTRTGVYAGIGSYEYQEIVRDEGGLEGPDTPLYLVTGNRFSTATGRISFVLGLEGPSIAVDTACSSSLVAVHQAVEGLQRGEAELTLAGGVCVILSPLTTEAFANAGMLSPTGQCWTFDERADGFVRSEGCGMLVLKRLAAAEAAGDRIWGVIRGSAVNQDGERPGLPVPRAATQARVIEEALSRAGLSPSQVDYLEAHGTGTKLGDPTEVEAAASVYGAGRGPDRPLLIGSVKTNIGHLAAAAGAAGLIKVLLSMRRGVIPRHLNFRNPNPQIDWERSRVRVTAEATEWPPASGRGPLAGVSSFGFSGTNSHIIVEGYGIPGRAAANGAMAWPAGAATRVAAGPMDALADVRPAEGEHLAREARILPLSGKSDDALRDLAGRYLAWLDGDRPESAAGETAADSLLSDMAWTAAVGRSHFGHRAGVVFRDARSLREALAALAEREPGDAPQPPARVAFAYTGQASQWVGMGRDLYETEPAVRAVLDRCDALLREARDGSLLDVMFGRPGAAGELDDPQWKQPAIYALECALTRLWESLGVRPDVVLGHSLGEIAAAQAAGVFSLEDGLRFAAARGALIGALPGEGAMAAVFAPASRVAAALQEHNASSREIGLCIAADNGAHQVVSGPAEEVDFLVARLEGQDVRATRLRKSPAYHSAMVEPALDGLEAALAGIEFSAPALALVSNLTGGEVEPGKTLDGAYWRRQVREPVAFSTCIETLANIGVDAVVEIGPHAVLGPMISVGWPEPGQRAAGPPATFASLRRPSRSSPGPAGRDAFLEAVAAAYESGLSIAFEGLFAGEARRRIALPGYPFQRRRHWIEAPKRRRAEAGHPLLGMRRDSPRGEVAFETEMFPSDPAWLDDHRVYGRVVAPGAMFGAMAASAAWNCGAVSVLLEDFQLHSPLTFLEDGAGERAEAAGRKIQLVLDPSEGRSARGYQIFSKGTEDGWTLHVEGRLSPAAGATAETRRRDPEELKAGLAAGDIASLYRNKASKGVDLGPAFRALRAIWSGENEAVGEVALPDGLARGGMELHPVMLDGCFQVVLAARDQVRVAGKSTYLPFGWERLWLGGPLPERVVCHVQMREVGGARGPEPDADESPEVLTADMRIYSPDGEPLGQVDGFVMKRATRAAMLSATETLSDLLYEVVWRHKDSVDGIQPADFLADPEAVAADLGSFAEFLAAEGVGAAERSALLADLDRLSRCYVLSALQRLGWRRRKGAAVEPESLRRELGVLPEHERLFRRLLGVLAEAGLLAAASDGAWVVAVGEGDAPPDPALDDPDGLAACLSDAHPNGANEIGLLRRCGGALAEVLRGRSDPLELLFGDDGPSAADLYRTAPAARAANRMLAAAVARAVSGLPADRRLRVLEIGAGTGSATERILRELPEGRFDYAFTDISAGFFAEAENRFAGSGAPIEYRALDIEADPEAQGFDLHGYDLVIAANVLHATRDLAESLRHCRSLLAPSGGLVALELVRGRNLQDLTFGLLEGWWRFADDYRPDHALAAPAVWKRALADAGFAGADVLGVDDSDRGQPLGPGIVAARSPARLERPPGVWIVIPDRGGLGGELAGSLAARRQTVLMTDEDADPERRPEEGPGVFETLVEMTSRDSWRVLAGGLPSHAPFRGVVSLAALDGHGTRAATAEMAADVQRHMTTALAMTQGLMDAGASPTHGVWLLTRGAQVLERERAGELAGAALWGFGKALAREASHLKPRMIDLDPGEAALPAAVIEELMSPDRENHVAYRAGARHVARMSRFGAATARIALPEDSAWRLEPDSSGSLERLSILEEARRPLEAEEVRVAVEAAGLNFRDVLRAMGALDSGLLGREMCGRILEVGADVTDVAIGDRVVGLAFGAFGPEVITRSELVVPAPARVPTAALATIPTAFVSAELCFEFAGLKAGERVLIHAGAGGVGLAAIQYARAAGARVIATASARKRAYLRALGVEEVFDSRSTDFAGEILDVTGGAGVDVVLNSLTGEGFIEASLSCLAPGGRFLEIAKRGIWSEARMAAERPDVAYFILELDTLKEEDAALSGKALRRAVERVEHGQLTPPVHCRWPLAEAPRAMAFMQSARHIGKIVLAMPPLSQGRLRADRTYLVTGGLGGIGSAVAGWLAERGAGTIVLNGRRAPDAAAEETIAALRHGGATVEVELADVTDPVAIDGMIARIDANLPPLGGVIHSVGVLSDGALTNQSWQRFEQVLWPKVLGAWHLHRATEGLDLDFFILFSSVVGVLGSFGQTNHAAANAFLDQLAAHRRALGLPGQSIAWGAWSGVGEAEEQRERIGDHLAARGARWITPQQGLKAFDRLVREDATNSVVMAADWPAYAESFDSHPSLLDELLDSVPAAVNDRPDATCDLLSGLRHASASAREDLLVSFLQRELQSVLHLAAAPPPTARFFDLGMDSLMAVELRNRLNRAFAGEYVAPNTVVFDYPDAAGLAGHLVETLGEVLGGPRPLARIEPLRAETPPRLSAADDGVAIVGMACRFPGAPDLSTYWDRLAAGMDAITDGRPGSGDWRGVIGDPDVDNAAYRRGGFVRDLDGFDASFFGIRPIEARTMDPQQRMLLETSWHALEDAGIDPAGLRGSRSGVYAGLSGCEYRDLISANGADASYLGTAGAVAAGRVAFVLGLMGPAMPVDMTCASSLAAIHEAAEALQRGEVDLALAGGVKAILSPAVAKFMVEVGMMSPNGQCRTFDASADGHVRGEGCGMIVLRRLQDAEADGDRIWGVIRGSAVNHNGTSAGLTIPSGPAQERVIEEALSRAGIAPPEVDYLEAHGTGSALGDPIEVLAAAAVYGRGREPERPLLLGTVKTNIGHLEAAAGIAGLIKVVLAMRHGVIPRHLHFANPTPHVDWSRLPVRVTSEPTAWPSDPGRPARAGVSAFGISGTNAHVVVEGYGTRSGRPAPEGSPSRVAASLPEGLAGTPSEGEDLSPRRTRVLPLSGKSGGAIGTLAKAYLAWLDEREDEWESGDTAAAPLLSDMAWTAGAGRSHHACRSGVVFSDAASLRERLAALAQADESPEPRKPPKVAFVYSGEGGRWATMAADLYDSEPVLRAVLDRCDAVFRHERGTSLLDRLLGRAGSPEQMDDPMWVYPSVYALGCALTALWISIGVRPSAVVGFDAGKPAAARAAGVFDLDGGMRLAATQGLADGVTAQEPQAAPSVALLDGATGQAMESDRLPDPAYWLGRPGEPASHDRCASALSERGIEALVEVGSGSAVASAIVSAWQGRSGEAGSPTLIASQPQLFDDRRALGSDGFATAVADAYEAGLDISFAALFAGETRRRILLPCYPFERRRYWIDAAGQ